MPAEKTELLLIGPPKPVIFNGLDPAFNLIRLPAGEGLREKFFAETAPRHPRHRDVGHLGAHRRRLHERACRSWRSCRRSASATTTSMPMGGARTASSSPTRRTC